MQNQSKGNLSMKICLAVGFHLRLLCYSQMHISYNVFTLRKKKKQNQKQLSFLQAGFCFTWWLSELKMKYGLFDVICLVYSGYGVKLQE